MIRRRRSPHRIALTVVCLALACARARAAEEGHSPKAEPSVATPENHPAPAPAPAAASEHSDKPAQPAPAAHAAEPANAGEHAPQPAKATEQAEAKPEPKRSPDEIASLLKLGVALTEREDYDAAEIAYRQVLNSPGAPDLQVKTALLGLAQMHRKQGALTKAAAIYERYLKDYPGDERIPDALLNLGRTLRSLGVYKLAIARFYSVINATLKLPGDGLDRYQVLAKTAQFEIAETHFQAGEFAEASKFYTRLRLLDLAPSDRARAHFKAGYALKLQGDREGAVTTLSAYVEQWPDDENVPEARYLLAVTLRELNRTQEAFTATLELLRAEKSRVAADPKRWAYWQRRTGNQLANDFFETGDTLNARAIYSGLLEISSDVHWRLPISYQVALCDERLGAYERARTAYQNIVTEAGATPPAELVELVKMAAWRIEHLAWREKVGAQISSFFETTTGKQAAAAPAAAIEDSAIESTGPVSPSAAVPAKTAATP
jgi:tetratricopeptide (TPR) repeat protein